MKKTFCIAAALLTILVLAPPAAAHHGPVNVCPGDPENDVVHVCVRANVEFGEENQPVPTVAPIDEWEPVCIISPLCVPFPAPGEPMDVPVPTAEPEVEDVRASVNPEPVLGPLCEWVPELCKRRPIDIIGTTT